MRLPGSSQRFSLYFYLLAGIFSIYFLFEYYFIKYSALSTDEFVFAKHILDYTQSLPYRDFPPYKTILGYYLLSIPFFFSHDLFTPLFWIKTEITFLNVLCLSAASYLAVTHFDKRACLLSVLAILANQLFLVYGSDLRVDMLTSWVCLFSALYVLRHQFKIGGMLLGIAFLISQKALWYVFAINAGMLLCWLSFLPHSRFNPRTLIQFNLAFIAPISIYFIIWASITNISDVFYNLFYEAYIQAGIDWYTPLYLTCWKAILSHGPLLFLLWPLTFIMLSNKNKAELENRIFIIGMASTALILFINYKQPFPYNFVFTIPAFFLLLAEFITWLIKQPTLDKQRWCTRFATIGTSLYTIGILALIYSFSLSIFYYLIALLPGLIYAYANQKISYRAFLTSFLSIFIFTGIIYPLYKSVHTALVIDGRYQQTMTTMTAEILGKEGDYISGIPFLYAKDQPIDGMKNLIGPAVDYLYQPTDKLNALLLPSLYLTASTPEKILADFERMPVKVIINNYRMLSLPASISTYIKNHYQHFYGSIYVYAPLITKNQLSIDIKFTGKYRIEAKNNARILLDKKVIKSGQVISLKQGPHVSDTKTTYRLALIPEIKQPLDQRYEKDEWMKMIKAIVY